jgi:antitoxin MazE
METTIKTTIIGIGNSRGIRIPKVLLEQTGMTEQVEIEVQASQLVVRPVIKTARAEWNEKFQQMAAREDDKMLDEIVSTSDWDEEDWQW